MPRLPRAVAAIWLVVALGCRSQSTPAGGQPAAGDASTPAGADAGATAADAPGAGSDAPAADDGAPSGPFRVLLFSKTAAYRHASIPTAIAALMDLQATGGYQAETTEDAAQFVADNLARFQVVVFLMTTGDVLDDTQQAAFEAWMSAGGSYMGVHSAADTEYDWPFYGQLVGAYFSRHPDIQKATVRIEATTHPTTVGLPDPWSRTDEWYDFRTNPRPNVTVLATLDESTYTGGMMGADHPIVWAHDTAGGGRAFYTAMGHTPESYGEAPFRQHLVAALRWVAGR
jgi:type 1 glutamine amidotransferase